MVQESKKAAPIWAHKEAACIASQLSCAVSLEPSLNSNTQALNPFWFSDSSQKSGAIATFWFLNSVTEWSQNLNFLYAAKRFWVLKELVRRQTGFRWMCWHWVSQPCSCLRKRKKRHWVSSWEKDCCFLSFHQPKVCNCETAITSSALSDFEAK